ncbi:MAG: molybdopterin-dependent oxidoreductase [Desulfocapsaceae bacterium]|nr:molybdopterin-dependent oxidoreductase [Desulfocapsaceae bacterium]
MAHRRRIIKQLAALSATIYFFWGETSRGVRTLWAKAKRRILARGTPMTELMHANPARLDTSNLETTPLEAFDVMGQTSFPVDLEEWRLTIDGAVESPKTLTYADLLNRPIIERNVLLICPGFFAYNGFWTGFSVADLLKEAGLYNDATEVKFSGAAGFRRKKRRFPLAEVLSDQVFIAYQVNGQQLPERHGFPVRLVAEDYKGRRWVKYLNRITVS